MDNLRMYTLCALIFPLQVSKYDKHYILVTIFAQIIVTF